MPRTPLPRRALGPVLATALMFAGCGASSDELYKRGLEAFHAQKLDQAVADLESFTAKGCGPTSNDPRCRKAFLTLARAYERRGSPARAWAAYDSARAFLPHTADANLQADLDRTRQALTEKQQARPDRGPLIVRYRDEVTDEYNPRSLAITLDFQPLLNKEKDASELHSAEFNKVYGGPVAAGEHVLVVDMVHDCKPSGVVGCARSHVRRAWPFDSEAHIPTTIDVRAYAKVGEGDGPARPSLEFRAR
jgi:tetratricopeptide (TPR) repeat protein